MEDKTKKIDEQVSCQICMMPGVSEGTAEAPHESWLRKLRLMGRRRLNPQQVRALQRKTVQMINWVKRLFGKKPPVAIASTSRVPKFKPGDWVRIRPKEEILATLNIWGQLKGCRYMPNEMAQYSGTVHRVFKHLERFVDERDYRVKASRGIYLLEGLYCEGTTDFGRCDRSCFYYWREEWLEQADPPVQDELSTAKDQ